MAVDHVEMHRYCAQITWQPRRTPTPHQLRPCSPLPSLRDAAGPVRCLQALLVVVAFLVVEVNVFFLKYALWVPPTNPLNTARLVLWLLVGAPAVREYYEFIEVRLHVQLRPVLFSIGHSKA